MGLDIYAGTLVRYYSRNWKTAVQQWAEQNGMQVNIIRPEGQDEGEAASVEEITEDVTGWRDRLLEALSAELSEKPLWNEDNDITPYYTDKPDWDALGALLLYTVCRAQGLDVPPTVEKRFDVYEMPVYKEYMQNKSGAVSLLDGDGWWIPITDSFMFGGYLPTGHERTIATVGMLKNELEAINAMEWNADRETMIGWSHTEGYPTDAVYKDGKVEYVEKHEEYDTVSLAKFAFSILWQAAEHALKYGTLIIYDY